MAKKNKGYIPLWREIQDHWIWTDVEPFDKRSAWTDLLLSVNHKEKKIFICNRVQIIKPGQMWTSYVKLAEKWHWSKKRVMRYLDLLKSDGMILTDSTTRGTLLTVVNYSRYTIQGNANDTAHDTAHDTDGVTAGDTAGDTQTIMNKNVNNDKERKEKEPALLEIEPPTGGGKWQ